MLSIRRINFKLVKINNFKKLSKIIYMSNFENEKVSAEKESTGSNLRKEIALNNDTDVRAVLTDAEYVQYIQDLNNDRDLTFKGKNVMDYNENEINSLNPEDYKKFSKLRVLQTRIKSQIIRARNQANNEERKNSIEERRRVLREKYKKERELRKIQDEKIKVRENERQQEAIKQLVNHNINLSIEPKTYENIPFKIKNIDNSKFLEERDKEINLILRGKIIELQEILRNIKPDSEYEIITNQDLEEKGFTRPTLQINEEGIKDLDTIDAIFEANEKAAESLEDKEKFFDILIRQVTKKAEKIPKEEIRNDYKRFINFLKSAMEIKERQEMLEYMGNALGPNSSLNIGEMAYILQADFEMEVLFVIFSIHSNELINPENIYSKKYLSLRKEKDYKKLYTKYKNKYLKLKEQLN